MKLVNGYDSMDVLHDFSTIFCKFRFTQDNTSKPRSWDSIFFFFLLNLIFGLLFLLFFSFLGVSIFIFIFVKLKL